MKGTLVLVAVFALLVGIVGAQNVIKYELSSSSALNIGDAVKLGATDNSCQVSGDGEGAEVIGFVAMTETDGVNYYNLIVNSGRITAAIHHGSGAVSIGDSLTAAAGGSLKVASAGDRVIAIATQAVASPPGACEVVVWLGPMPGADGAKIWQAVVSGTPVDITASATGVQSIANISITDCDVEDMLIQFTGTADDKGSAAGGAVVNVDITQGGTPAPGGQLATQAVYLVDRHFYQQQSLALTARLDVSLTDDPTFDVYVWESDGLTNGRITQGILTIVGTPR